jgi:hypothetical protein
MLLGHSAQPVGEGTHVALAQAGGDGGRRLGAVDLGLPHREPDL